MTDIALNLIDNCFDISVEDGDISIDEGLETAVAISLFSDRRITEDDLIYPETDKRGWWGDTLADNDGDQIGSRIWLLERSKRTNETLRRSEEFCLESLDWLKEDGIADEITAQSEYDDNKQLITEIELTRPDQQSERFSVLWDAQELKRS